jgi:glutaminyl-peptide cyclotransferase
VRRRVVHAAALVVVALTVVIAVGEPQTPAPPRVDGASALRHVERLVGMGPRVAGSPGGERARAYIVDELRRSGIEPEVQAFDAATPHGRKRMANVIARLPGRRPDVIVLAGHYDTKLFTSFRFVGANDGGSSAALLVELGRALAARHRAAPPAYTHWLLFFDGEEAQEQWSPSDSLYGSRALVATLRADGELPRLRALLVADMIGDRDLGIRREAASTPWLTDLVWSVARRLGHARHFLDERQPVEDDHAPFLDAGVAATLLIDFDYGGRPGENRYWHTEEDTLDKVDPASLRVAGEVILAALPAIEAELDRRSR